MKPSKFISLWIGIMFVSICMSIGVLEVIYLTVALTMMNPQYIVARHLYVQPMIWLAIFFLGLAVYRVLTKLAKGE